MKKFLFVFLIVISSISYLTNSYAQTIYYEDLDFYLPKEILYEIAADTTNSYVDEIGDKIKAKNSDIERIDILRNEDMISLKLFILNNGDILTPVLEFYKNDLYRISMDLARGEIINKMKNADANIKQIESEYKDDVLKLKISYKLPRPRDASVPEVEKPVEETQGKVSETVTAKTKPEPVSAEPAKVIEKPSPEPEPKPVATVPETKPDPEPEPTVEESKPEPVPEPVTATHKPKTKPEPEQEPVEAKPANDTRPETEPEPETVIEEAGTVKDVNVGKIVDKLMIPSIDGLEDEAIWREVSSTVIKLVRDDGKKLRVTVKAAYYSDSLYILARWFDKSKDDTHETLVWDEKTDEYVASGDIEDSIAMLFYIGDVKSSCMTSGEDASADYWHWRAARSKESGYAYDGMMKISGKKLPRANSFKAADGKKVWIQSVSDSGSAPWKLNLPIKKSGDKIPSYVKNTPTISSADVKASGNYSNKRWTVEFVRELNTNHKDDIVFDPKQRYKFSIAIYDSAVKMSHFKSPLIDLVFNR